MGYTKKKYENHVEKACFTEIKMDREGVIKAIDETKLIAILRKIPSEKIERVAAALYAGGVRVCEAAFSANLPYDAETVENIKLLKEKFGGKMAVGAGTVLTCEQVEQAARAGAEFIVSPDVNVEVIKKTVACKMASVPGAFTPTEAMTAHRAGADFIKVFPSGGVTPEYLAAMTTPLSHLKFLAVGGVTENNAVEFIRAGAVGIGVSTGLVPKEAVACDDYALIEKRAAEYVALMAKTR